MAKALNDFLGWVALTKAVEAIKDGVPNPFPKSLFTVKADDRFIGPSVKFSRTYGTRQTAKVIKWGSPTVHVPMQDEELAEMKCISFGETRVLDPYILTVLRDYESFENAMMGKRLVANNVKTLGTKMANSRIVAVATTLAYGNIYTDSSGNLLPSSSGASFTYSHQIPAANIGTIVDGTGNIFGATGGGTWATSTVDIPAQLRRLQKWAAMSHGYTPRIALYGENIPSYFAKNDYVKDYLAREGAMRGQYLRDNTIPDGLFGFKWIPVWESSFTKADGTKSSIWPATGVTFLPGEDDMGQCWGMMEGSNPIPTTINIATTAEAALSSFKNVHGVYGYSQITVQPPGVAMTVGDTFWPAVKLPSTIYIADCVS